MYTSEDVLNYINLTVDEATAPLKELISIIEQSMSIRMENGGVVSENTLSSEELEVLVMKIPAECLFLQSQITKYNASHTINELETAGRITDHIEEMKSEKGSAPERLRKAEKMELEHVKLNNANKIIVKNLQLVIDRADKVYEGIKKVIDYRTKEAWFDRKHVS